MGVKYHFEVDDDDSQVKGQLFGLSDIFYIHLFCSLFRISSSALHQPLTQEIDHFASAALIQCLSTK
jgi:hypothetical protein